MEPLDGVIHAPGRLAIMTTLSGLGVGTTLTFPRLQEVTQLTSGNLSTHLSKLESAGYVLVNKFFKGRKPVTSVEITNQGQAAYATYLQSLTALLGQSRPSPKE